MNSKEVSLTEGVRVVCGSVVRKHLAYEENLFDHVWPSFWTALGCSSIQELRAVPPLDVAESPVVHLGAAGTEALDTLYVIGAVTQCVLELLNKYPQQRPLVADVAAAMRIGASTVGAPERLRHILQGPALSLLAEYMGASDWGQDDTSIDALHGYELWVQWCDVPREKLGSNGVGSSKFDYRRISSDRFGPVDVAKKFEKSKARYLLYIDERDDAIYVHQGQSSETVEWNQLDARHLLLLGLILQALLHGQPIAYWQVAVTALGCTKEGWKHSQVNVRRTKRELDRKLKDTLTEVVVPKKGADQYTIERQIPYCWVRVAGAQSRLLPSGA